MDMRGIKFCPNCEKLLHYEDDENIQLWLICNRCSYKTRADNVVVYLKEFPDYLEEKETIPITKEVRCPHCGHGEAGFFEEWVENKPNIARTNGSSKTPAFNLSQDIYDSDWDEEEEIARWKKEKLRQRRKSHPDERSLEATAKWEEKLRSEEVTRRMEIQRRKRNNPAPPDARRALIFVCCSSSCGQTWEGD
ncbi:hypothetical protein MPTK1_2g16330 [Marchantia polymorpha subsp. ruderalis]|nr:hypothetical protein MARPO_0122s0031 [Marchantia polymorpha]PTQ30601.1 hypothetical protein MARPO_0122s0031 [Marchantia polymorpha]BBN02568.1 hypothetical protein Mp_2g16330 [Marchantia polymorpha subsp. ruderalis]BBN02569.1 hypothetical protein Mp_2g16330 [Marchantia polymorpha subsp. ruderalis]|eukprot:PTQ30600.1 hypothetical protein MARPO_0122s0031 [Marchantia polymorpha]